MDKDKIYAEATAEAEIHWSFLDEWETKTLSTDMSMDEIKEFAFLAGFKHGFKHGVEYAESHQIEDRISGADQEILILPGKDSMAYSTSTDITDDSRREPGGRGT